MSDVELQLLRSRLEKLYVELLEIEQQLHPVITRLRKTLGEFLGIPEEVTRPIPKLEKPVEQPRISITPAEAPPTVTVARPAIPIFRRQSYRIHKFAIAPQEITFEGGSFDLGEYYDTVIMSPSIDTQIEIDKQVEPTTPVIFANTFFNLDDVTVRTIYYKGVSRVLKGRLSVWAFKY